MISVPSPAGEERGVARRAAFQRWAQHAGGAGGMLHTPFPRDRELSPTAVRPSRPLPHVAAHPAARSTGRGMDSQLTSMSHNVECRCHVCCQTRRACWQTREPRPRAVLTHLAQSCGRGRRRPGPDPTRSAPDAGVPRRGSLHRGIMADDEEMEVEKDSKEGPPAVKKWCGSRPVPGWPLRWLQPGLRPGV